MKYQTLILKDIHRLCSLLNSAIFIGATREEQLEENVGSGNISLSAQDADDLGKLFEGKKK